MTAGAAPLPSEAQEPVLQFALWKRLRYRDRLVWVAALVAVGMLLQVAFLSVLPGVPFIGVAVALSWVVGFDNKLDRRGLRPDRAWRRAPFERVTSIVRLDADMKSWDSSAFDVSNPVGCSALLVATAAIAGASLLALVTLGGGVAAIVAFDGAALVVLQWFSGMRSIHRKPDLVLKAQHLSTVVRGARDDIAAAGELHAQLLLREHETGATPDDVRLLIDVADPPAKMLGVQGQVVLNRVQGTPYPYFYCVVIADAGGGLASFAEPFATDGPGTTIEVKPQDDVDVVVIRRTTTKTSGYHTKPRTSRRLLETALRIATAYRDQAAHASR